MLPPQQWVSTKMEDTMTSARLSFALFASLGLLLTACGSKDDTATTDTSVEADTDTDTDADTDTDTDTDVQYFEPFAIGFQFYMGYSPKEGLVDVDGSPPFAIISIYEEEYLDSYDDRYACDMYFTMEGAPGTMFADSWNDLALTLTPYDSSCDELDPNIYSDDYMGLQASSWEVGITALTDTDVISYLEQWDLYDDDDTFAGLLAQDGTQYSGSSSNEVLVGWAYEIDENNSVIDPKTPSLLEPIVTQAGPVYYQIFSMYMWYL